MAVFAVMSLGQPMSRSLFLSILHNLVSKSSMTFHDFPNTGLQGTDKTLDRIRQAGYWANTIDVEVYFCECCACQAAKSSPLKVSLTSVQIGKPRQMVAIDILDLDHAHSLSMESVSVSSICPSTLHTS